MTNGAIGCPKIRLESIYKSFSVNGRQELVLGGINLTAAGGEFVSIIGPSGCGKTTLLNVVAGFENLDSGEIILDTISADKRLGKIGYMQQKDLLLPWRTVLGNIVLGLELNGVSRRKARERALALAETFGLKGFENQYPATLSGGMRQRAAFLRTMLQNRDIMLLDEPFGALDALTRVQMQEWLLGLWGSLNLTILHVTHDIDEAILLSDRVYVLTARPAKIAMVLEVELPRPRDHWAMVEPGFADLKSKLVSCLRSESARQAHEQVAKLPR